MMKYFCKIFSNCYRIRTVVCSTPSIRPGGEIGRHKRLKISRFRKGRAGSIPASGTTQ